MWVGPDADSSQAGWRHNRGRQERLRPTGARPTLLLRYGPEHVRHVALEPQREAASRMDSALDSQVAPSGELSEAGPTGRGAGDG